jgi:hypothetical protein
MDMEIKKKEDMCKLLNDLRKKISQKLCSSDHQRKTKKRYCVNGEHKISSALKMEVSEDEDWETTVGIVHGKHMEG